MHKVIYGCTLLFASSIANAELLINSPVQVCDILVTQGLSTRGWIDNYGYGCSSNYKEIGIGSPLANNIAYYADGNANSVNQAKLVLNVNNKSQQKKAISELINSSGLLSKKLAGEELPQNLTKSIKKGKQATAVVGKTTIEVTRDEWPSGNGYEIHVIFK